jgi:hypothetical protein
MPSDLSLPRRLHHLPRCRTRGAQSPNADRPSASLLCATPAPSLGARRPSMAGCQTLLHSIAGWSRAPGLNLFARCARYSLGSCPPASLLVLSGQPRSLSMAELILRASLSLARELSVSLRTAASPLPGRSSSKLLAVRPSTRHFVHGRRPSSSPYVRTSARISSGPRAPLPRPCPPRLSLSGALRWPQIGASRASCSLLAQLSIRRRITYSLSAPSKFPRRALLRRLPLILPLNFRALQRSSSLLLPSPNIIAHSRSREFFPVHARAPLLGPSSFSSSLPHSAVRRHRSVARQADCVSCVTHPRPSSTRRSSSHCVRQYRLFPCPVLARFPARQRAISARSALKSLSRRRPRRDLVRPACWSLSHTVPFSSDSALARRCVVHSRVVEPVIPCSTPTSPACSRLNRRSSSIRASSRNPKNQVKTKLAALYSPSARQIGWIRKSLLISRIRVSC